MRKKEAQMRICAISLAAGLVAMSALAAGPAIKSGPVGDAAIDAVNGALHSIPSQMQVEVGKFLSSSNYDVVLFNRNISATVASPQVNAAAGAAPAGQATLDVQAVAGSFVAQFANPRNQQDLTSAAQKLSGLVMVLPPA